MTSLSDCYACGGGLCVMSSARIQSDLDPVIVHSRAAIADILKGLRHKAGMTCEAFDYHAGFSDRYVTKMENGGKPGMRQGFQISAMAEVWLEALGVCLVLMPTKMAEAIGAKRMATVAP